MLLLRVLGAVAIGSFLCCSAAHSATLTLAQDNYETGSGVGYGGTSGTGFGAHTDLGGPGGIFHTTGGAKIDGAGSLGSFSGNGSESWGRTFTNTSAFASQPVARFDGSMRFNIPNDNNTLKGLNLKSGLGGGFGANELLSVGMINSIGHQSLLVTGTTQQTINFGQEIRGSVIDVGVQWNTSTGAYTLTATRRGTTPITMSVSGTVKNPGSYVPGAAGFIHSDIGGSGNDVFFDNLKLTALNVASAVNDDTINNVMAGDPTPGNNPVTHMFTATNADSDTLTWTNFAFDSYAPAYGGAGPGPNFNATFNPGNQAFSWNTNGSPRGIYKWKVDVSDGESSDTGFLTVHVTEVPEPAAATIGVLALLGIAVVRRR